MSVTTICNGIEFRLENGSLGFSKARWETLCQSQLNVGDPAKYPEFKGSIVSVETRGFGRTKKETSFPYGARLE